MFLTKSTSAHQHYAKRCVNFRKGQNEQLMVIRGDRVGEMALELVLEE